MLVQKHDTDLQFETANKTAMSSVDPFIHPDLLPALCLSVMTSSYCLLSSYNKVLSLKHKHMSINERTAVVILLPGR